MDIELGRPSVTSPNARAESSFLTAICAPGRTVMGSPKLMSAMVMVAALGRRGCARRGLGGLRSRWPCPNLVSRWRYWISLPHAAIAATRHRAAQNIRIFFIVSPIDCLTRTRLSTEFGSTRPSFYNAPFLQRRGEGTHGLAERLRRIPRVGASPARSRRTSRRAGTARSTPARQDSVVLLRTVRGRRCPAAGRRPPRGTNWTGRRRPATASP